MDVLFLLLPAVRLLSVVVPVVLAAAYVLLDEVRWRRACYGIAVAVALLGQAILTSVSPFIGEGSFLPARIVFSALIAAPLARAISERLPRRWRKPSATALLLGLPALVAWHYFFIRIDPLGELPSEPRRAAAYFRRRCDRGDRGLRDDGACTQLGWRYFVGEGVPRDLPKAASLFERACGMGDREGCFFLGHCLDQGFGVARDLGKAIPLYEKSCQWGFGSACCAVAALQEAGESVARDPVRAAALNDRACSEGFPCGCTQLGMQRMRGEGVALDRVEAAALFRQACRDNARGGPGKREACYQLGRLYEHGEGVRKHAGEAVSLYRTACDEKLELACEALARLEVENP